MMGKVEDVLSSNVERHLAAIDLCLANQCRMPALILAYSWIDILAALNRPANSPDVTRQDFIAWCDAYLAPAGFTQCRSIDLYAARCSIIHTYTSESRLSRAGDAKQLVYAWGNRRPEWLQRLIDWAGIPHLAVIHIDELVSALRSATDAFLRSAKADASKWALIMQRSNKLFGERHDPIGP